jgi:4a-hydroxytetrahydrobiopterin dehydratase
MAGSALDISAEPALAVATRLSDEQVQQQLEQLSGWQIDNAELFCRYEFDDFIESIEFVNQIVEPAETIGHHPDLAIAYNVVDVSLTTHDAGGLTQLDFDLANQISQIGQNLAANDGCF